MYLILEDMKGIGKAAHVVYCKHNEEYQLFILCNYRICCSPLSKLVALSYYTFQEITFYVS